MIKENLFGKTLSELQEIVVNLGLKKFVAKQLADWLYKKRVRSFDEMHNLSKAVREKLAENYSVNYIASTSVQESVDGTKKYLFPEFCVVTLSAIHPACFATQDHPKGYAALADRFLNRSPGDKLKRYPYSLFFFITADMTN